MAKKIEEVEASLVLRAGSRSRVRAGLNARWRPCRTRRTWNTAQQTASSAAQTAVDVIASAPGAAHDAASAAASAAQAGADAIATGLGTGTSAAAETARQVTETVVHSASIYEPAWRDLHEGWYKTLRVVGLAPYAIYYGALQVGKRVNEGGSHLGLPGIIGARALNILALVPLGEAIGLAGDVGVDILENKSASGSAICDEDYVGPILPLAKSDGPGGVPETYLPGIHTIHKGCRSVDFEY